MSKVLLLLATVLVVSLAQAGAASAATSFQRVGAFNEALPDGQAAHQHRIAVNQASGEVYVTDPVNDQVAVYKPNGTGADPLTTFGSGVLTDPFGIAIDQSTGDVYVSDATQVVKYTSDGAATPTFFQGVFISPAATGPLAFDQSDDQLLLADRTTNHVRRYSTVGIAVSDFDGSAGSGSPGAFTGLQDLAVDSAGDVVVVDATGNPARNDGSVSRVERFASNGEWKATIGPVDQAATVAIHPGDDNVIVSGNQNTVYSSGTPTLRLFDPAGASLGDLPVDQGLPFATIAGIAGDDGASGQLFVASDNGDYSNGVDQYSYGATSVQVYDPLVVPGVSTGAASSLTANSATLDGTVDPDGVDVTYHFEYGPTVDYGSSTPESDPLTGSGAQPATADLVGLAPGTGYHYRLVATSANATIVGQDETFTTAPEAPTIASVSAAPTYTEAELKATINPGGASSTYRFEYGATDAYGASTVVQATTAGAAPVNVSAHISGLVAGSTYHFRLVVSNLVDEVASPDQTFATAGRAPQQGSCANAAIRAQQDAERLPDCRAYEMASPVDKNDGDVLVYFTNFPFDFLDSASPDGNAVSFQSRIASGDAAKSSPANNFIARRGAGGWESTNLELPGPGGAAADTVADYSEDLSAMVLADGPSAAASSLRLRPDITAPLTSPISEISAPSLSSYAGATPDLSHILFQDAGLRTPGAPASALSNLYEYTAGGVRLVSVLPGGTAAPDGGAIGGSDGGDPTQAYGAAHAISDDGKRIFFSTVDERRLYVRENGTETVEVSASQRETPVVHAPVTFQTATPNGRLAYFTTSESLLDDEGDDGSVDLYRYDVDTRALTNLTDSLSADVGGVMGTSRDGSYVYFGASGNPFVWHDGQITPIGNGAGVQSDAYPGTVQTSRVSDDGRRLAFLDSGRVYVYDAPTGSLRCPSCSGTPSGGAARLPASRLAHALNDSPTSNPRSMSSDGRRVFFSSADGLVPEDTNDRFDAYMYDVDAGKVHLLSSGHGTAPTYFVEASASGDDAFFVTRDRLVAADRDDNYDLYDARVGGGFAQPSTSTPCQGDACQPPTSATPAVPVAGSVTFQGAGDAAGRPAPRSGSMSVSKIKTVTGTTATLKVKVPAAGAVTLSGSAVRKAARAASKAATYSVKVSLSAKARASLKKKRTLKAVVTVAFKPKSGKSTSKKVTLTFRQPKGKTSASKHTTSAEHRVARRATAPSTSPAR